MQNRAQPQVGEAEEYRTNDLYFAAYLQAAGVTLTRTDRNNSNGKVAFIFDSSIVNIAGLKQCYFNRQGKIEALPYADAIKSLKAMVHL
jgi:hypothetical protein